MKAQQDVPLNPRVSLNPLDRLWLTTQHRVLHHLRALAQRLHPRHLKAPHLLTGERGEFEALFYLRRLGFQVVERRWHAPDLRGDLDLIAWDGDTLVIAEVKTRTARDLTPALSAVDDVKRRTLRDLAKAYRRTIPRNPESPPLLRFDIVSVYLLSRERGQKVECEILRDAFPLQPGTTWNPRSGYGV